MIICLILNNIQVSRELRINHLFNLVSITSKKTRDPFRITLVTLKKSDIGNSILADLNFYSKM